MLQTFRKKKQASGSQVKICEYWVGTRSSILQADGAAT